MFIILKLLLLYFGLLNCFWMVSAFSINMLHYAFNILLIWVCWLLYWLECYLYCSSLLQTEAMSLNRTGTRAGQLGRLSMLRWTLGVQCEKWVGDLTQLCLPLAPRLRPPVQQRGDLTFPPSKGCQSNDLPFSTCPSGTQSLRVL